MATIDKYIGKSDENRDQSNIRGNEIYNYQRGRASYYDPLEEQYRQQADTAYSDLNQTPGYTSEETAGIMGDPDAAFRYYNPDQLSSDMTQGNREVADAATNYGGGIRSAADRTGTGLRGAATGIRSDVYGAANDIGTGVTAAADRARGDLAAPSQDQTNWQNGVYGYLRGENEGSLDEYGNALDSTADRGKLGLSTDFAKNYDLSDEDVQGIKNAASQSTAGQYRKMSDQAAMRAAAEGNTSPAALAAIQEQLGREGAIQAGNAASTAALAANSERAARRKDVEGMRLNTEQDISNRGTANAGSLYGARSGSAKDLASLEQQGIQSITGNRQQGATTAANLGYNAADTAGKAKMDAAGTAGQYGYSAEAGAADKDYQAADQSGQAGMDASKFGANNRQQVDTANQTVGQGLATGADAARSGRTTGVANTRIGGQTTYRGYLTDQQKQAQTGSQGAASNEINAYGTQGNLANQATGTQIQAASAKDAQPGTFSKILGAATGVASGLLSKFEDGGVITEPTLGIVGENGPEQVVKVGRERSRFGRYGMPIAA